MYSFIKNKVLERYSSDTIFKLIAAIAAGIVLIIMAAMFVELSINSKLSLQKFGLKFLVTDIWNPVTGEFGGLSSIYGTLISTIIAMLVAVPLSLVIAFYLVEIAHPKVAKIIGPAIELLAAVPSIIYGMWGLFVFAPFMSDHVKPFLSKYFGFLPLFQGPPMGIGMLSAGIILALMILPFISAVMRDVFQMVPSVVKEAAHGMGSTLWEVTYKVTIKYGIKGLIGACFLGLGRAIGETMAVTFVIGNNHGISSSLFSPSSSIASTLANEFTEASDPLYLSSLIELGLVLFVVTMFIQIIAQIWLKRISKSMGGGL